MSSCLWEFVYMIVRTDLRSLRSLRLQRLVGILGASWGISGHLGSNWGAFCEHFGVYVGVCWGMLAYLKTSWTYKSVILKNMDFILFFTMFLSPLGASWGILGATWEHFGSILGVYVGLCWGMMAYLKTSWTYKSVNLKNVDFILFFTVFLSPHRNLS